MLPVSLDCLFLIAPSVLSKVYFFLSSITDKTFTGFYKQSRETGNIWYIRRRKTSKNTTQYVLYIKTYSKLDEKEKPPFAI
jgi:uncharacterized phage-like protein YoqJ